jgi:hypothetical protein
MRILDLTTEEEIALMPEDPRDKVFEMIACIEQMIEEIKQYLDDCNTQIDDGKVWYAFEVKDGKLIE